MLSEEIPSQLLTTDGDIDSLSGCDVSITWRSEIPGSSWTHYRVLGVSSMTRYIRLEAINPDGSRVDAAPQVWANLDLIRDITPFASNGQTP